MVYLSLLSGTWKIHLLLFVVFIILEYGECQNHIVIQHWSMLLTFSNHLIHREQKRDRAEKACSAATTPKAWPNPKNQLESSTGPRR